MFEIIYNQSPINKTSENKINQIDVFERKYIRRNKKSTVPKAGGIKVEEVE